MYVEEGWRGWIGTHICCFCKGLRNQRKKICVFDAGAGAGASYKSEPATGTPSPCARDNKVYLYAAKVAGKSSAHILSAAIV